MCAGATHRLWGRHTDLSQRSAGSQNAGKLAKFGAVALTMLIAGSAMGGINTSVLNDVFVVSASDGMTLVTPRFGEFLNEPSRGGRGFGEITRVMMFGGGGTGVPALAMSGLSEGAALASADSWRSRDIDTVVPRSEKPTANDSGSESGDEEDAFTVKNHGRVLYKGTFDNVSTPEQIPEWRLADDSRAPLTNTPTGRRFLGELSNGGAKLSVQNVPLEGTVEVEFDVFAINAWDGNGGGDGSQDAWGVRIKGGQELFVTNFAAVGEGRDLRQAYPAPLGKGDYPAGTAATELNTLGYSFNGEPMDAVYRIKLSFKPTDEAVEIEFYGKNLQADGGQAWGLDNVVVRSMPLGSGGGGAGGFASNINSLGGMFDGMGGHGLPDAINPDLGNHSTPSTGGGGGGGGGTPPEPDSTPEVPAPASIVVLAMGAAGLRRRR